MRKSLVLASVLLLAACQKQGEQPQPNAAQPATETPAPAAKPAKAATNKIQELKSPLPDGFVLPFSYNRLYDNSVRDKKNGKAQRRVMAEFLDVEPAAAEDALRNSLTQAGFTQSPTPGDEGATVYTRADGTQVTTKFDPAPKRLRAKNAKGTVHFVWQAP